MDFASFLLSGTESHDSSYFGRFLALHMLRLAEEIPLHIQSWWSPVADLDFLVAWVSRGNVWTPRFIFHSIRGVLVLAFLLLAVYAVPVHHVWSYFVIASPFFVVNAYDAATRAKPRYTLQLSSSWSVPILSLLVFCSYSSFLVGVAVTCSDLHLDSHTAGKISIFLFLSAPLLLLVGWHVASIRDLQDKKQILEALLDKATDGFCSVEAATGIICSVSPQLQSTLGTSDSLVGKCVYEFVQNGDHCAIQNILEGQSQIGQMNSKLVTCLQNPCSCTSHEQLTFDAAIIPFTTSAGKLEMCFKVQGEMRKHLQDNSPVELCKMFSPLSKTSTATRSSSKNSPSRSSTTMPSFEVALAYTVTESVDSLTDLSEEAIQTGELLQVPCGRDLPILGLPNFGLPEQHSDHAKKELLVTSGTHSQLPLLFPKLLSRALSLVPLVRSRVGCGMAPPNQRRLAGQVSEVESVWPEQVAKASQQCVDSETDSLRSIPRSRLGRRRLGRNVSKTTV